MSKSRSATVEAGRVIAGRYQVEAPLGRGGMATIYRVHDSKTGKQLALKRGWARDPRKMVKRRALLEREFHTLAHLSHPRIIEVYDYGVDDDGPFYTMELLDGADLDQSPRLPWREASALLRDVASSLAILHSRGLIHRDVSLRNVRRTADGRAKLIDFGAMMSAGVANDVVGTPPFMAPEVLQMQALDARADLFSLGALGYHLLSGRHAFPARKLSELRDLWRSRVTPLTRLFPEIPAALSDLILQLLALDRTARPDAAGEVMERLCAIADLPKEELPEISRAYLATPTLVGREKALVSVRNRMLSLVRGDGGVLLIEAFSGLGRSRLVDACVFEGKLLGTLIVRADASYASGEWGVARAIGSQLFERLPKETADAVRLSRHVLTHVLDEIGRDLSTDLSVSMTFPERSQILRELRDLVLTLARHQRLIVVIDDVDRIDDASAAWLAALADKTERQNLLLVLSAEPPAAGHASASLDFLRSIAQHVNLEPLTEEQTTTLMRSVFGDVANLQLCAGRIQALAQGNPRTSMELAQHMVARGLARYEAGSWLLPAELDENDLPSTLSESLLRRLNGLGPDARELAETLCITDGFALTPHTYRTLSTHRDLDRIFRAFEELVAARILTEGVDSYRFSQRGFHAVLQTTMSHARSTELHARFADFLAASAGDVLQCAHHLLNGGRELAAVRMLCSIDLKAKSPSLALLERAVEYAQSDALVSARDVHLLSSALLQKASLLVAVESFRKHLPRVLKQLEQDSGLGLYAELSALPADTRLSEALAQQQQRYLATPEHKRVHSVSDGARELARLTGVVCSMAGWNVDIELIEGLPSLEPLFPLSPALPLISQLTSACRDLIVGRAQRSMQQYEQVLARMAEPDRGGLEATQYERMRLTVHYALALFDASLGVERVEARAKILEANRGTRVGAWRLRALLHIHQGNAEAAHKCMRRGELLQLQDGTDSYYRGATAGFELRACGLAEDLPGVKTALEAISSLADQHSGWRPTQILGQSRYRELQGDLQGALELLLPGFELARPGRHMLFGFIAAAHVRLLRELNDTSAALEHAQSYLAVCAREELTVSDALLRLEYALTLSRVGEHELAVRESDSLIRDSESVGSTGLALGVFYETRARVAIAMGDREGFDQARAQCAREYQKGRSTALNARFARLVETARLQGLIESEALGEIPQQLEQEPATEHSTVSSRLIECLDGPDRARCALTMLLQSTNSYLGHLYGVNGSGLRPLAGLPDLAAEEGVEQWLERWVEAEGELASQTSVTLGTATMSQPPPRSNEVDSESNATCSLDLSVESSRHGVPTTYSNSEGRCFRALLLVGERQGERRIAAVLALQTSSSLDLRPSEHFLSQIAVQLLEHGDVEGLLVTTNTAATQERPSYKRGSLAGPTDASDVGAAATAALSAKDKAPAPAGVSTRYEVIDSLGQGGMATVQRVRDHTLGKTVALKRLLQGPDESHNRKTRTLFEREFHVLSQLAHPRVVEVYDYGIDASGPYYTMEVLDGGDLHALAPVPWQRTCSLLRDVCSVVSLLHSRRLVHRDISPRNVRCTSDGLAKLLDFGAMAPMGPVKQIVGTPPICAPELLDLEPLDARSDLYSLGATFYYALVGRHAYPARDLRQLRQLWLSAPPPPSAFVPGIPQDVDSLVMSLLSLDSAARPVSAAEVMERLTAIADLQPDEQLKVSNAYLYSPSLVGRTHLLERARRRFTRARDRRGSGTLLIGAAGVGRSRLFAACMLDAKLLGMTTLRADASDNQRGDYGGVRAIASQLLESLPEIALAAAEPRIGVLGHIIPELLERMPEAQLASFDDPSQRRPRVQQALREWLHEISRQHPIALGIDDIDLIDEPTRAFTALLVGEIARQAIAVLVTAQPAAASIAAGPMKVLRETTTQLNLVCLDLAETQELVRSVFGDAAHRQLLAHKLFAISAGNPRDIMQLARHLVERGAIRYASGSWSLPAHIDQADLPATIALAHQARIDALSEDSRTLALTLAFAPDLALTLDHVPLLCGHQDSARMLRSIDELLTAGVLRAAGRYFEFAQAAFAPLLRAHVQGEARQAAHLRLAAVFEERGESFRVAQHLLRAGAEQRGLDTLVDHARESVALTDQNLQAYEELLLRLPADWFETYNVGIALCKRLGRPRRDLYALWMRVSGLTPAGLDDTVGVADLIQQLRYDTGLDLYESLPATMEPVARLGKSFELSTARYQATPEDQRVLETIDAMRALGRACIQAVGTVTARLDLELWEALPSLKPFEPLSPALGVIDLLIAGNGKRITGRTEQARALYRQLLERATQPDRAGLDETHQRYVVSGVTFGLGFMEAPMGLDSALEHAQAIERDPVHQVNALLIRVLHQLWQGDARSADQTKREIELLRIQNSPRVLFEGTHLIGEIAAHAASDDLLRIKQTIDSVALIAKNLPGWTPLLRLARGESQRIRGGYLDALSEIELGLAQTVAGRHQLWCDLASAHLKTLDAAGRHSEARELGERYLREADAAELGYRTSYIKLPLAAVYAALGERIAAEQLADSALECFRTLGSSGLNLGLAYEARARVAVRVGDLEGFDLYARECGTIYRATANRALIAKHERLLREGRTAASTTSSARDAASTPPGRNTADQIVTMLAACASSQARAQLGLELMVARSGALSGFLYAIDGAGPTLVARAGQDEPPSELIVLVSQRLRAEIEDSDTTASETDSDSSGAAVLTSSTSFAELTDSGRLLRPIVIGQRVDEHFRATGMAVLVVDPGMPYNDPSDVAAHLCSAWLEAGDVTAVSAWLSAPAHANTM